jgi:YidC/Oxa1 family membrane protein insertase
MDQARLFIAIALSFLIFFIWNTFFTPKNEPPKETPGSEQAQSAANRPGSAVPEQATPTRDDRTPSATKPEVQKVVDATVAVRELKVVTPLFDAQLSERGGNLELFTLHNYREEVAADAPQKVMIDKDNHARMPNIGLGQRNPGALQNERFQCNSAAAEMTVKDQARSVSYTWTSPDGIILEKEYTFTPDSYLIGFTVRIKNGTAHELQDQLIISQSKYLPEQKNRYGHEGPSALIDGKVQQFKRKEVQEGKTAEGKIQWLTIEGRYFMEGVVAEDPFDGSVKMFFTDQDVVESQLIIPNVLLAPGSQRDFKFSLYIGPKSLSILSEAGYDLKKVINFGWFDLLAKPCLWFMNKLYSVIPNYGIAIIIMTIIIKVLLWPLGSKSYKSMNEMKRIQPLMAGIREKYKDDKKKQNQEMMALYKTYKINPMGGCLPMLMQLPVFLALYNMLYTAIELRHAPFFGWINDLSAPDRLFNFDFSIPFMQPPYGIPVLTLIMGVSMFFQQKMSPPPGDPTQAKMMMFMPIVFTFIFINFSSGLVLYWLVNNLLSMGQQLYIQKKYS